MRSVVVERIYAVKTCGSVSVASINNCQKSVTVGVGKRVVICGKN